MIRVNKTRTAQQAWEVHVEGLVAQEARLAARERARIGHDRVDLPWRTFCHDPRCAPGVLLWFDDATEPLLIGDINVEGGECDDCSSVRGAWVREMVDARPMLAGIVEALPPVLSAPAARSSWANAIMSMQSGPECTRELRQMLVDAMDVVEQEPDEKPLVAALAAFDRVVEAIAPLEPR
jgi:hypothetical protein